MTTPAQPAPHEAITAALRVADGLSDRQVRLAMVYLFTDLSLYCLSVPRLDREEIAAAVERAVQHAERVKI